MWTLYPAPPQKIFTFSSVTLAEIRFRIEKAPDPHDRAILTHWLTLTIRPLFAGRVLEVTEDIMLAFLVEQGRNVGHPVFTTGSDHRGKCPSPRAHRRHAEPKGF